MQLHGEQYSVQNKKVNGAEGAKYFFPVEVSIFFLVPYSFGKKNCLTNLICNYGLLTFFL